MYYQNLKGKEFVSKSGVRVKVLKKSGKTKAGNIIWMCEILEPVHEGGRIVEYMAFKLKERNFGLYQSYNKDKELHKILKRKYDSMLSRCKNRLAYEEVKIGFRNYTEFYNTCVESLNKYNQIEQLKLGKLELDKDLLSIINHCKSYSSDTILFVTKQENCGIIKRITNIKDENKKLELAEEYLNLRNKTLLTEVA